MLSSLTALLLLSSGPKFVGRPAPAFELKDVDGKTVSTKSLLGTPYVLFSFCSCDACKRMGTEWAKTQKKTPTKTVFSFFGTKEQAIEYEERVGLDPKQTIILDDPNQVIIEKYMGMPCPTMFAIDERGLVAFASKEMLGDNENDPSLFISLSLNRLANFKTAAIEEAKAGVVLPKLRAVRRGNDVLNGPGDLFATDTVKFRNETWIFSRSFHFTNTSKQTLHLNKLVNSCGCAGSDILFKGQKVDKVDLKPGQSVEIRINAKQTTGDHQVKLVQAWLYDERSSEFVATARWQITTEMQ